MAAARGDPRRRPGSVFTVQSANCRPGPCRDGLNSASNSLYTRDTLNSREGCRAILSNDRITKTFSRDDLKSGFSRDGSRDVLAEVSVDTPLSVSYNGTESNSRNAQVTILNFVSSKNNEKVILIDKKFFSRIKYLLAFEFVLIRYLKPIFFWQVVLSKWHLILWQHKWHFIRQCQFILIIFRFSTNLLQVSISKKCVHV